MVLEILATLAGGYAALVAAMALFQRAMIYHPGRRPAFPAAEEADLLEMAPVPVRTRDGWLVTGWYAPPSAHDARGRPRGTVVFLHGNAGSAADRARKARALMAAGFGLFLVEYRGYGGNPGRPSETGLYNDARAVLTWMVSRGVAIDRVVLYGESLGSGVAVQMALDYPAIAALILEAPFTRLPDLAPPLVPSFIAGLLMADRYDNLAKIGQVAPPLLVIHGEQDVVVPAAMGRALLDAATTEKTGLFLPKAGHNDLWDFGAGEEVAKFLSERGL